MIARNISTGMAKLRLVEKFDSIREGKVTQLPQVPQELKFQVYCMTLKLIWGKKLTRCRAPCSLSAKPPFASWTTSSAGNTAGRLDTVCFEAWILAYASVNRVSSSTTLQSNEDDRTHNWDEVERQVHDIANESLRSELLEW